MQTHTKQSQTKPKRPAAIETISVLRWEVNSFKPYKTPDPDNAGPKMLQKGPAIIETTICKLMRGFLAYGYIHAWRAAKIIFIPKPSKTNYEHTDKCV